MSESVACLNCQHAFGDPRPRFCPACGQESNLEPPTLMEFAQQFGGAYFSTEGALWRTLKLLLLEPGELTRQYLAGRRKHYVLPLRLYLTISVIVLLAFRIASPAGTPKVDAEIESARRESPAQISDHGIRIEIGPARVGMKDGRFHCTNLPEAICLRLKRRIDLEPKAIARESVAFGERFVANLGGALFFLVPAFAAWMKLVYRNRRRRYTEHLVFALHLHAFWFPVLALLFVGSDAAAAFATFVAPGYTLAAMKRVYGGRWWPLLLRAAVVFLLHLMAFTVAIGGVAIWTLLF